MMYKTPKNAGQSKAAFEFFKWALDNGQSDAQSLNYIPLPTALTQQVEAYWSKTFK
jgi:phosphate transport system substrate-binding protein